MEINNIDKTVRDSLKSRVIQPSNSAWERLSNQLDVAQEKKRKNWFLYAGYAASVLLLISVAFFINTNDDIDPNIPETVVVNPIIDTTNLVEPTFKNTAPIKTVIVSTEKKEDVKKTQKKRVLHKKSIELKVTDVVKDNSRIVIASTQKIENDTTKRVSDTRIKIDSDALLAEVTQTVKETTKKTKAKLPVLTKKDFKKNSISINSDVLLYAVTHSDAEVLDYYKKYKINRDEVLKSIQKELIKNNLKIDANILLADVEKHIDEDTFKKSFMQVVKGKITGLASAFANRNN